MRSLRAWLIRFFGLFGKSTREQELADEIETNLQLHIEDNVRSGMTPEEARRAALVTFGGLDAAKEACRDRRSIPSIATIPQDVRYALRMLGRNKGWTAVAVLSLALGIGANSALFSIVNTYALRKLPAPDPDELVAFRWYGENNLQNQGSDDAYIARSPGEGAGSGFTFATLQEFRNSNQTLSGIFAFARAGSLNVFANGRAEFASGQFVTGNFYTELGGSAAAGRTLTAEDDSPQAEPVVVISHAYWQRRFAMDGGTVGSSLTIDGMPFTIVGITQPGFVDPSRRGFPTAPDISIPLSMEPRVRQKVSWLNVPAIWWLMVVGRLKPGITAEQAQANFSGVFDRVAREDWNRFVAIMPPQTRANPEFGGRAPRAPQLRIVSASRGVSDSQPEVLGGFAVFGGIFGIVLLIVCVNLANLLLSRSTARRQEIAIRLALGATRRRLIRQLLTESTVIAFLGGAAGLLIALWCMTLLNAVAFRIAEYEPVAFDSNVFLFSALLTAGTAILFGAIPAFRATRLEAGSKFTASRSLLGKSLVVAQVALSLVLVVTAGLFVRTLVNLQQVNLGFNPGNIALLTVQPGLSGYDRPRAVALYEQIEQRLRAVPGVRSVAFVGPDPLLAGGETTGGVYIEGESSSPDIHQAAFLAAHSNFFETMGIPLKLGRAFSGEETPATPGVAVVNEAFVRTFSRDTNPVGRRFATQPGTPAGIEIVGVVADVKVNSLRQSAPPLFFRPITQVGMPSRTVVVRTAEDAKALLPAIQEAMQKIDPRLPLRNVSTQMDQISMNYLLHERIFAFSAMFFGGLALAVAMIGLFGLMSYSVARRTKEIGIRMALGAKRQDVLSSVMRESLRLVGLGVLAGLPAALILTRLLSSLLFGLAPHDPATLGIAIFLMLTVSVLAGYLPARRAARVDPMVALRYE